jgi:hypothetical protein
MEQRRLRLGDILDDYCPRERRVTNHAVVAMIEEDVKQTRCTTCEAEHAYKGGREPRRRKKEATSALYREVLADMPEPVNVSAPTELEEAEPVAAAPDPVVEVAEESAAEAETEAPSESEEPRVADPIEEGPVHRQLIRATLPRPEGQKERERPLPEFTVRHNAGRGQFRGRPQGGNGNGNGNRGFGRRFAGGQQTPMSGRGPAGRGGGGGAFRGQQNQQQRHGGKKRSR